jgi:hypothetical protein
MSRIEFSGKGSPNPEFALPDPGSESTLPPLVLQLTDGEPFLPAPYVELGYTNYEVWCVGAAGGQGGNGGGNPWPAHYFDPPNDGQDRNYVFSFQLSWPYYFVGSTTHYHDPYLDNTRLWGGGGGGGGLEVVSGLLLLLPDECSVVVGEAGDDAPLGQIAGNGTYTPPSHPYPSGSEVYDLPHPSFAPPTYGEDGGYSSFNNDMCQASGGKGGNPSAVWESGGGQYWSGKLRIDGNGGQGGTGGQTTAGGGGAGGSTPGAGGENGTWNGHIGKGGGGGMGGTCSPDPPPIPYNPG